MDDLVFYNVGCHEPKGKARVIVPFRRALRRILRPIFQRQVQIYQSLCDRLDAAEQRDNALQTHVVNLVARHDELTDQVQVVQAFGWDYIAMTRRLAILEDRVEALLTAESERAASDGSRLPMAAYKIEPPRAEAG